MPIELQWISWQGVVLAAGVLRGSLVIDPGWSLRWLGMIHDYERVVPLVYLPALGMLLWPDIRAHWTVGSLRALVAMPARERLAALGQASSRLLTRQRQTGPD